MSPPRTGCSGPVGARAAWETPNDLDAIEAHVAASTYIGLAEERIFRNLIAEVRDLRERLYTMTVVSGGRA